MWGVRLSFNLILTAFTFDITVYHLRLTRSEGESLGGVAGGDDEREAMRGTESSGACRV